MGLGFLVDWICAERVLRSASGKLNSATARAGARWHVGTIDEGVSGAKWKESRGATDGAPRALRRLVFRFSS